ncbi:MAG: hypothetical protein CSA58_10415 [Micrococcales bacterium]|nr:MAG: hypothetical protein CSA58_10415 [Micrococcales bacterium]
MADPAGRHVLVTAGGGFLGSYVVTLLAEAGARVCSIDTAPTWREPMADLVGRGTVRQIITPWWQDPARLAGELGPVDDLLHLGYVPGRGTPLERARAEVEVNLAATLALVQALRPARVVFASTAHVYGPNPNLPFAESEPLRPVEPYAGAKAAAEVQLGFAARAGEFALTILRLATLFGPMETVPRAVPNYIRAGLARRPGQIRGDGRERSDYLYVEDAATAVTAALARHRCGEEEPVRIYNVSTGTGTATRDIATLVADAVAQATPQLGPVPEPEFVSGQRRPDLMLDPALTRSDLGWSAQVGLRDGIAREVQWFLTRPDLAPLSS